MAAYREMSDRLFAICESEYGNSGTIAHNAIASLCFKDPPLPLESLEAYEANAGSDGVMNRNQCFDWAMAVLGRSQTAD